MLENKDHVEMRFSGFGGQGIIMAGVVLGRAAAVNEGRNAVMAQSYGPESRGGAANAEVLIANGEIAYPHVVAPDVVVTLAQEAYRMFGATRPASALLICEKDLVTLDPKAEEGKKCLRVPFTALAEKVGRKVVMNMVVLGFVCRATHVVKPDALRAAIKESVPKGTEELNLKAFDTGYNYTEALQA